jgi:hypothetical protein
VIDATLGAAATTGAEIGGVAVVEQAARKMATIIVAESLVVILMEHLPGAECVEASGLMLTAS